MRRLALTLILLLALVSGCASPSRVDFIPEGGSYTADGLAEALKAVDPEAAARVDAEDAVDVRQEALADLRTHGDQAAALADVLTAEFPPETAAVPFRVERGTYEGAEVWVVFEAWGDSGGKLDYRRVWIFSYDDKAVLAALSDR